MERFLPLAAVASLSLHACLLGMFSAVASDTSCTTSGADGCSCQTFPCDVNDQSEPCNVLSDCQEIVMDCYSYKVTGEVSYHTGEGSDAKICVTTGPLVGGGCSHGGDTYCKAIRTCHCDAFGACCLTETEDGFYTPCTPHS